MYTYQRWHHSKCNFGVLPQNTYFLFQGKYYKQIHNAAMGSPISPLITSLFMVEFAVKALSSVPHPPPMAKVCGSHLCHSAGKTQSTIMTTHQFIEPKYTVCHRGTKPRRIPTFPGHPGFSRSQHHTSHYSLQQTYTH